jgi:hypothetical protein
VNLFLMLSGTVPFGARAKTEEAIYAALQTETLHFEGVWERSTPAVRELLTGLLDKDPAKRYTLAQVLAHPWVSGDAASDERIDRSILSSLLSFTAKNKFKKEALRLAATAMTAQDVAKLRTAFMRIDADNSGFITFAELSQEVGKLEVADAARISTAMREMDADGDGKVSYDEFITAVVDRQLVHHQNMCVALADRNARARARARAQGRERGRACAASARGLQPSALCGPLTASFSPLPRPPLFPARSPPQDLVRLLRVRPRRRRQDHARRALARARHARRAAREGGGLHQRVRLQRRRAHRLRGVHAHAAAEGREGALRTARAQSPPERARARASACVRARVSSAPRCALDLASLARSHAPLPRSRCAASPSAPSAQFRVKHELNEVVSVSRAKADAEAAAARLAEMDSAATRLAAAAAAAEEAVVEAAVAAGVAPEEL